MSHYHNELMNINVYIHNFYLSIYTFKFFLEYSVLQRKITVWKIICWVKCTGKTLVSTWKRICLWGKQKNSELLRELLTESKKALNNKVPETGKSEGEEEWGQGWVQTKIYIIKSSIYIYKEESKYLSYMKRKCIVKQPYLIKENFTRESQ